MKRAGNLIERIASPDNLRLAFFKAWRDTREPSAVTYRKERQTVGKASVHVRDLVGKGVRIPVDDL